MAQSRMGTERLVPRRRFGIPERRRGMLVIVIMLLVGACLHILRNPASIFDPTIWAEDGTIFFKNAIEGGWGATFTSYQGQLFVAPRVAAALLAPLSASVQPALYAGVSIALAVGSCGIVLSSRWRDPVPRGARFLCLLALLCAPGVGETFGTLANAHWWLGVGLVLLGMLRDPGGRWGKIAELGYVAVASMSGFAALFGLPSIGVRALRVRSRQSVSLVAVALLGIAIEVVALLGSDRRGDLAKLVSDPATAVLVLAKRVVATSAIGDTGVGALWPSRFPESLAAVLAIALTAALALIWIRGRSLEIGALLLVLVGGWVLALWAMTSPGAGLEMLLWPTAASRFFLIPRAVLYVSLVVSWPLDRVRKALLGIACVLLLGGILLDYQVARLPALDWGLFAHCVDSARGPCSITIPPGWLLEVSGRGP